MNTKNFITSIISILLLSALVEVQLIDLVHGNVFPDPGPDLPRIYIRNDGSVEPATAPIERTGNLYKLADNIVLYTIEIQRDNIVIDGAGHTIQGNASRIKGYDDGNNGVIVTGRNNVTITRLNFEQGDTGVRVSTSSHINITGNTFTNGLTTGTSTEDSSFVLIENNNFTNIGKLDFFGSQAILCTGRNNIIKGNIMTDVGKGINLEGYSNIISDNRIEATNPIKMDRADSNIITRNIISGPARGSDQNQFTGVEGIWLFADCSNTIISRNNITGFSVEAIRITYGSNNTVYGNYFANNEFAINLDGDAAETTVYSNTFTADSCKIHIYDVTDTLWDNGTIGNYWGDYNGTDDNGDGIGDTPYIIVGYKWDTDVGGFVSFVSSQDNYPLMEPIAISEFPSRMPMLLPLIALVVALALYKWKLHKPKAAR
jgi:parallel beta-helix repeat protein